MSVAARKQERLGRTLLALADPTRRALLERVGAGPRRATDLSRGLPMSRPAVAKHLRVLKSAGLVTAVPQGREVLYQRAEDQDALDEARAYFERMSADWDRALAAFKRFAEAEEER
ncbi:MAG TPA: metalloregulator ArsR/SmtB family transcription factor [Myxococcota bacterium]|nr:metalloregulator ArsR/SmtB family transcription factor [Myxococcota bacterium]